VRANLPAVFTWQKGGKMKARLLVISAVVLCALLFVSCKDDPARVRIPPVESNWPDLTQKDDIFEYLDLVYEEMDIDRFPKLLDDDFIFVFSQADFNRGTTPEQWGRNEELASARNMFTSYAHPTYGAITSIDLDIAPEGLWIEVPKTEPPYDGETWYQKTAEYRIIMETTSQYTLQGNEKKALFTVRLVEVDGVDIYRIVQWSDDIE
jgi:hypothetical protein